MMKINDGRVGTLLCPRGYQTAWADDKPVCPRYSLRTNLPCAGLRRTWWYACKDETINPVKPTRLPLLFALDAKLNLADGFHYVPDYSKDKSKKNDHAAAVNCATDFGSSSSDSSSSSDGFGDLGFTSSDAGGDSGSGGGGED